MVDIVSKGGNYLLNVGPDALGQFPQQSIERLSAIGEWIDINGEAIYGTEPSPIAAPDWGRITRIGITDDITRLFLHVFEWPGENGLKLEGITGDVIDAFLLSDSHRNSLDFSTQNTGVMIDVPERAPPSSTVKLLIRRSRRGSIV